MMTGDPTPNGPDLLGPLKEPAGLVRMRLCNVRMRLLNPCIGESSHVLPSHSGFRVSTALNDQVRDLIEPIGKEDPVLGGAYRRWGAFLRRLTGGEGGVGLRHGPPSSLLTSATPTALRATAMSVCSSPKVATVPRRVTTPAETVVLQEVVEGTLQYAARS
jgi:hypothetical protein